MKRLLCLALVLMLSSTAFGQFPGSKPPGGGFPGSKPPGGGFSGGRPPGGGFGGQPSIGGMIVEGIIRGAAEAERDRRRQEYYRPPTRTVVVQEARPQTVVVQAPKQAPIQVETARVTESPKPLTLTKNTTTAAAKSATKDIINKAKNALNKEIAEKLDSLIDSLEEATMTEDKANALAQKWIDEGKDKKQISDFLNAANNGDAETAGKLGSELTGDPLEGNKIAKAINFGNKLFELKDSVQNGEFGTQDFADLKKLIDKANLPTKLKKDTQKILAGFKDRLKLLEIFTAFKDLAKTVIPVPTAAVTVIYCPSLPNNVVYAVDSETYMIKGDEFGIAEEDISDAFQQVPVYSNPVSQSTNTTVNQLNLVNTTGQTANYHLDDNATKTLKSGNKASFSVPDSGTISISSQGRWKSFSVGTGTYKLTYSGGVWSVVTEPITVTLDNSGNPLPFYCLVDRTEHTINPGEQISFSSSNGVLDVQFARDEDAGNRSVYQFESSATYKIGLDQRDNKFALFP